MQVEIEEVGPCKKKLAVEVPAERVREEFDKTYDTLNDIVDVPGFRRGHVPRWLLERRFSKTLSEEVRESLLRTTLADIIEEHKLQALGAPDFTEVEFEADKPMTFNVTLEVKPTFDLPEYDSIELTREVSKVTGQDVDEAVDRFRRAHGKLVKDDADVTGADSYILADVTVKAEDAEPFTRENAVIGVADESIMTIPVEGLDRKLADAHVGDSRTFDAEIPESFPVESLSGRRGEVHVSVKEIQRLEVPDVDEEFLKNAGFESEESMRERLKQTLSAQREQAAQERLQEQLSDQLLEKIAFGLPEDVVKRQIESLVKRRQLEMVRAGVPEEEVARRAEEFADDSQADAERSVRLFFILDAVASKEEITAGDAEVESRVAGMAQRWGIPQQKMYVWLERNDMMDDLTSEIRVEKTRRFLVENVTVNDASVNASEEQ